MVKYVFVVFVVLVVFFPDPADAQFVGPAVVQPDASLVVGGKRFVLADIAIIPTGRPCESGLLNRVCETPAAVALRERIVHLVSCRVRADIPGLETAVCRHAAAFPESGEDLGVYLIAEGWAAALPNAPPLYHTMETIARSHGRGMWGVRLEDLIDPLSQ